MKYRVKTLPKVLFFIIAPAIPFLFTGCHNRPKVIFKTERYTNVYNGTFSVRTRVVMLNQKYIFAECIYEVDRMTKNFDSVPIILKEEDKKAKKYIWALKQDSVLLNSL